MRRQLKGIAASGGLAIGPAFVYIPEKPEIKRYKVTDVSAELARFDHAVDSTRRELAAILERARESMGEELASIFEAHLLFLEDPELIDAVRHKVEAECCNAEAAVSEVVAQLVEAFEAIEDEYLRARAADVRDVGDRLIRNLLEWGGSSLADLTSPVIVVARDLAPSDTAQLDHETVLGLCTAKGGITSHTAILARALSIPAVVGLGNEIMEVHGGQLLLVDGGEGIVLIDPTEKDIAAHRKREARRVAQYTAALAMAQEPARTKDGKRVEVVANIGDIASARDALAQGAEGIGLMRTEFLYLERPDLPNEKEQYRAYLAIAEIMEQRPVIVRTLDIGGDKQLPALNLPPEQNPFLGQRALRLALERTDLLRSQLKAILRAGYGHNLKVMFPMVADIGEVRRAKEILQGAVEELRACGEPFAWPIEVGIMVEIPAAALAADILAQEVDFFSIGSNDLIQYTMACDRTNEKVAYLYQPFHPAVLRLIRITIEAAHKEERWVGLCGEMAGQPEAIPILLGLGLDEFSMTPSLIPRAKQIIRALTTSQAREIAAKALEMKRAQDIETYAREVLHTLEGNG